MVGAGLHGQPPDPRHRCGSCTSTAFGAQPGGWNLSQVPGWVRCPRCLAADRAALYHRTFVQKGGGQVRRRQRTVAERERVAAVTPPDDVVALVEQVQVTTGLERRALVEQIMPAHPTVGAQRISEWCGGEPRRRTVSTWRRRLVETGEVSAIGPGGLVIE